MARDSLSILRGAFPTSDNYDAMLQDVVALLAYVQPEVHSFSRISLNSLMTSVF